MNTVVTILVTILIFGLLIFIHELGHYIAARIFHVGIKEFAIGMGPKLFSRRGKHNVFSVRALPIGGFVSMVGEYADDHEEDLDEADRGKTPLNTIPVWRRIVICLAGPLMNVLLGMLVMSLVVVSTPVLGSTTGRPICRGQHERRLRPPAGRYDFRGRRAEDPCDYRIELRHRRRRH